MPMSKRCLYCCGALSTDSDYHVECCRAFFGSATPPELPFYMDEMKALAKNLISKRVAVPGVQPKLSLSLLNSKKGEPRQRFTIVGSLGGNYILKPPSETYPELPENEHITMLMARELGIRVVPSSLIRMGSGELCYITKRVDRNASGTKLHMLDFYQVTEAYDKYRGSLEKVGKGILLYSSDALLDIQRFFELCVFAFVTGNNDMHLKNFSLLLSTQGWVLSPAYDLLNVNLALPLDRDDTALTIDGKKRNLIKATWKKFGIKLGLNAKQIASVLENMQKAKSKMLNLLDNSFLSETTKDAYKALLEERLHRLG